MSTPDTNQPSNPPNLPQLLERDQALLIGINEYAQYVNAWSHKKGFWDSNNAIDFLPKEGAVLGGHFRKMLVKLIKSQKIMLMVSELSELLEGLRADAPGKVEGFTNEEEELADFFIRGLDYAGEYKLRLAECIIAKMAVNEGRPHRHGKSF